VARVVVFRVVLVVGIGLGLGVLVEVLPLVFGLIKPITTSTMWNFVGGVGVGFFDEWGARGIISYNVPVYEYTKSRY